MRVYRDGFRFVKDAPPTEAMMLAQSVVTETPGTRGYAVENEPPYVCVFTREDDGRITQAEFRGDAIPKELWAPLHLNA